MDLFRSFVSGIARCWGCCMGGGAQAPPVAKVVLTSDQVRSILVRTFPSCPTESISLADGSYVCVDPQQVRDFLRGNSVDKLRYTKEQYDCDDFAMTLNGDWRRWYHELPGSPDDASSVFGIVHGDLRSESQPKKERPHAMNFFVDNTAAQAVWLIEPQTDAMFSRIVDGSSAWLIVV